MTHVEMEAVTVDDNYNGTEQEAWELIKQFVKETDSHITTEYNDHAETPDGEPAVRLERYPGNMSAKYPTTWDRDGDVTVQRIQRYPRHSEPWWTSIAVLLIYDSKGVVQFLKYVEDIPGLTMGFCVEGDNRVKTFSDTDITLIDTSTNYDVEKIGEANGDVIAKIHEEDWRHLYDDAHNDELDVNLQPEHELGVAINEK